MDFKSTVKKQSTFARGLRQTEAGAWVWSPQSAGKGPNRSTVTRWKSKGVIVKNLDGEILIAESIAAINKNQGHRSDLRAKHAQSRGESLPAGKNATTATELPEDEDMTATVETVGMDRAHYKAIAIDFRNKQAKLDEALERGLRIPTDQRDKQLAGLANDLKTSVERLIDNLAPQLTELDSEQRHQRIMNEINQIIEVTQCN